jgi:hypothetical protein
MDTRNVRRRARQQELRAGATKGPAHRPVSFNDKEHIARRTAYAVRRHVDKLHSVIGDTSLQAVLQSKQAREVFPKVTAQLDRAKVAETQHKATSKFLNTFGPRSQHRAAAMAVLSAGQGATAFARRHGINSSSVWDAQHRYRSQQRVQKPPLFTSKCTPGLSREKSLAEERIATMEWLKQQDFMVVRSGARSETFKLTKLKEEGYANYVIEFGRLMRKLHTDHPELRASRDQVATGQLSVLQKNIEAVLVQDLGLGPRGSLESSGSLDAASEGVTIRALKNRALCLGIKKLDTSWSVTCGVAARELVIDDYKTLLIDSCASAAVEATTDGSFDAQNWQLQPRDYKTFWYTWAKAEGVRFTVEKKPHQCPLCSTMASVRAEVDLLAARLAEVRVDHPDDKRRIQELESSLCEAQRRQDKIDLHREHYKNQRPYVDALEDSLPAGGQEIIVFEDFVAQYDINGNKWKVLVFAVRYRSADGQLRTRYLDVVAPDARVGRQLHGAGP